MSALQRDAVIGDGIGEITVTDVWGFTFAPTLYGQSFFGYGICDTTYIGSDTRTIIYSYDARKESPIDYRYLGSAVSNLRIYQPSYSTDHVIATWEYDKTGFEDLEVVFLVFKNGVFQAPELINTYATIGGLKEDELVRVDIIAALSNEVDTFDFDTSITILDHVKVEWYNSPSPDVRSYRVDIDGTTQAYLDAITGKIVTP